MVDVSKSQKVRRLLRFLVILSAGLGLLLWLGYSAWNYPFIAVYHYASSDGGFEDEEIPAKGRTFSSIQKYFEDYRTQKGDPTLQLYRSDDRDWRNLLRYPDYLSNPRWKLHRKAR